MGATVAALLSPSAIAQMKAAAFEGPPVRIGQGDARTVVRTDAEGRVASIGVVFGAAALEGLPKPDAGAHPNFAYLLPMPSDGPPTLVDHVVINWEAAGHPPPHVYDVPHFDFHFYFVSHAEQQQIAFASPQESGDANQQPPPELMAAGYVVPPGTAVPQMGVHAVDPKAPEFQGQGFTATLVYGYYKQRFIFIEPMASLEFLKSKQSYVASVPRPAGYSKVGAKTDVFPSLYSVKYDEKKMTHEVMLEGLK
ncbi:MAG TPA: DUF5602 domain-containing protein [Aromatoleum sp.]|uniref:DUF5602 domain-containing protein n=1 Tax=Aromatoleum sp. TaxID=2307007 RepID=UPI002B46C47D|nr:DUF5602 domain-containing protein [Aromatoleum sp.]HJV24044.1 DUF5602 domain-containing protein [Aromatoleum sp.]